MLANIDFDPVDAEIEHVSKTLHTVFEFFPGGAAVSNYVKLFTYLSHSSMHALEVTGETTSLNYNRGETPADTDSMARLEPDPDSQLTLDDKVIDQLKQDMGEDAEMVIESYVESIDEFLCDIENRTVRTSSDDLHRWAHTIKSSAASIGAMRLAHLAAQMENSYRDRIQIDLGEQLQSMQQEYRRVNASLEKITNS